MFNSVGENHRGRIKTGTTSQEFLESGGQKEFFFVYSFLMSFVLIKLFAYLFVQFLSIFPPLLEHRNFVFRVTV